MLAIRECPHGHDIARVGRAKNGRCAACQREKDKTAMARREAAIRGGTYRMRKTVCPKNHDKTVVGVALNGRCAECDRALRRRQQRRRARRRARGKPLSRLFAQHVPNLQELRLAWGLTQAELAAMAGLERSTISKIENEVNRASPFAQKKIVGALMRLQRGAA